MTVDNVFSGVAQKFLDSIDKLVKEYCEKHAKRLEQVKTSK